MGNFARKFEGQGRSAGFSLVMVVVGTAVLLGVGMYVLDNVLFSHKEAIQGALAVEKSLIKDALNKNVDCVKTMQSAACPQSSPVVIWGKDTSGAAVVIGSNSGAGTQYGRFTVRAECGSNGGLIIKAARLRNGGSLTSTAAQDFIPEPLTNQVVTWSSSSAFLMNGTEELCGSSGTITCNGGAFCSLSDFKSQLMVVTASLTNNGVGCGTGGSHFTGWAMCPAGYYATGYGVECNFGSGIGGLLSQFTNASASGWYADGCSTSGTVGKEVLYTVCMKLP